MISIELLLLPGRYRVYGSSIPDARGRERRETEGPATLAESQTGHRRELPYTQVRATD